MDILVYQYMYKHLHLQYICIYIYIYIYTCNHVCEHPKGLSPYSSNFRNTGDTNYIFATIIMIIIPGAPHNHHGHRPCERPKRRFVVIRWTALPKVHIQ